MGYYCFDNNSRDSARETKVMANSFLIAIGLLVVVVAVTGGQFGLFSSVYPSNVRSFNYQIDATTSARCQSPSEATLAVVNPSNIKVTSASVTARVVASPSVNMIGTSKVLSLKTDYGLSECDIFNSRCDNAQRMTAFIPESEISVDGTCSYTYSISFERPDNAQPDMPSEPVIQPPVNNTIGTQPAAKQSLSPYFMLLGILIFFVGVIRK
jgi:hypothetical protein